MVHQNESAFVCLWHLTALLDDFCRGCRQEWHTCLFADLDEPLLASAAALKAQAADLVVFCQAGSAGLPPGAMRWSDAWVAAKRGRHAAIGWVNSRPYPEAGFAETETHVRNLARKGHMKYLGVKRCSLMGQHQNDPLAELAVGLAEPPTNECREVLPWSDSAQLQ